MRRKLPTVAEGYVPKTHGIPTAYNRGCRCGPCTRSNTERAKRNGANMRLQRKRFAERVHVDGRLVHPDPYGGHGSITAYTSCGCRCDECRAVIAAHRREKYAEKRDAQIEAGPVTGNPFDYRPTRPGTTAESED